MKTEAFTPLLLLALVPGWVYLSVRHRKLPAQARTALSELLELVTASIGTTGPVTLIWLLASTSGLPGLVRSSAWLADPGAYTIAHTRLVAANAAAILVLACALAFIIASLQYRRFPDHGGGDAWWHALRDRPQGTSHYAAVTLDDGVVIEGFLLAFGTEVGLTGDPRDIALARPIRVTAAGGRAVAQEVDRLVIAERHIRFVSSRYVRRPRGAASVAASRSATLLRWWRARA